MESKSMLLSSTAWGIIVGLLGHLGFFTWVSVKFGVPIPDDNTIIVNTIIGVVGDLYGLYGRWKSTQPVHLFVPFTAGGAQSGFIRFSNLALLIVTVAIIAVLTGCATSSTGQVQPVVPKSPTQAVMVAEVSLTVATNALADVHDKGMIQGENYEKAKAIEKQAAEVIRDARVAAMSGDQNKVQVLLNLAAALMVDLAKYNGGVQ